MTCFGRPCNSTLILLTCPLSACILWRCWCNCSKRASKGRLTEHVKEGRVFVTVTLNWVTNFWFDFAWHLNSLILEMTMVWFIQHSHWALTFVVSCWHLRSAEFECSCYRPLPLYPCLCPWILASFIISLHKVMLSDTPVSLKLERPTEMLQACLMA